MAKKMEKKSARLLAFMLALIMIGSVLAMAFRGGQSSPGREVDYEFYDFNEWLEKVPVGAEHIIYVDADCNDEELLNYIESIIEKNWNRYIFSNLVIEHPIEKMLIAGYRDGLLYMIDVNKTRVFYSGERKEYKGFSVKVGNGVMLVTETSPFIIGTTPHVANAIDVIVSGKGGTSELVANYTSRISKDFKIIFMFYGESANMLLSSGNFSDYVDFYIEGIGTNGSLYEKVIGIHFKGDGGFVDSNVTEYYNYTNYEDFSVVIMQDSNFTKLINAQPKLKPIISIEPVE
jgi:hypothetical protein